MWARLDCMVVRISLLLWNAGLSDTADERLGDDVLTVQELDGRETGTPVAQRHRPLAMTNNGATASNIT